MANTHGEKELKTDWPFTEGLIAGTTKLSKTPYLIPEISNIQSKDKVGID